MKKEKNKLLKRILFILVPILVLTGLYNFIINGKNNTEKEMSYNEFMNKVDNKEIDKVRIDFDESVFTVKDTDKNKYIVENPKYDNFKKDLLQKDVKVIEYNKIKLRNVIQSLLPIVSITLLILLINRSLGSALKKQSQAVAQNTGVTFNDIAGLEPIKKDMEQLVDFIKNPKKYTDKGAKLPKGAILHGDPGTGKTLLAKAMAGEAGVPFFSESGSNFVELFVGQGAKRVRELFKTARENAPCIVFIDEIDAIGKSRGKGIGNNDEREQTLNQLLIEMDGFNNRDGILVVCATNRIDVLDSALIRPGRFDKHICVPIPQTANERLEIINIYTKNKKFDKDVNLKSLAKETIGFSPADIEALINEATLISVQLNKECVDKECIDKAKFKTMLKGHAKEGTDRNIDEMKLVAWHEAGHALVGKLLGMDITTVTITPSTSGAGGVTFVAPKKLGLHSVEELKDNVKMVYGGRVAEYLLLKDAEKVTTGASSDIQNATKTIKEMIVNYGMSNKYGMLNLNELGVDDKTILEEAVKLSDILYKDTLELLRENENTLEKIANLLLEKETISQDELDKIIYK